MRTLLSLSLAACAAVAAPSPASARGVQNGPARAACGKALQRGDLDAIRVGWTVWLTREISQTVEIAQGKLARRGGYVRNARSERPLTDDEKRQLLAGLRAARVDKLVWVDRDVKNDQDRVLNIDLLKQDGSVDPVGAFVRTGASWRSGATAPLAALLEKWLAPGESK
jgi:hypothetical protein